MKYKIILWGTGIDFEKYLNNVLFEQVKGNLEIIGITSNDTCYDTIDGIPFYKKGDLKALEYNFIIVMSSYKYDDILQEAKNMGLDLAKLIKIDCFLKSNFDFARYANILINPISIISNNCYAGNLYHYLEMPFNSPFINMWETDNDYLKMLKNLKEYLGKELEFDSWDYNTVDEHYFPVFRLEDIKLYFNHYLDIDEAKRCWYRRLDRMNYKNLFIVMYTDNEETAKEFNKLDFEKKIVFVPFESKIDSAISLNIFLEQQEKFYNGVFWETVFATINGRLKSYDILKMLNGEKDFMRISI